MGLFDFLKPRPTPEAIYQLCIKEQSPIAEWEGDEIMTWGVIREITFDLESSMARAKLLVPRGDRCVVVPCDSYKRFVKIGGAWRVGAEPSLGLMGNSKLIRGTIALETGDAVQVFLSKDNLLPEPEFPRTDGWGVSMIAKFLPYQGCRLGQCYFFQMPEI